MHTFKHISPPVSVSTEAQGKHMQVAVAPIQLRPRASPDICRMRLTAALNFVSIQRELQLRAALKTVVLKHRLQVNRSVHCYVRKYLKDFTEAIENAIDKPSSARVKTHCTPVVLFRGLGFRVLGGGLGFRFRVNSQRGRILLTQSAAGCAAGCFCMQLCLAPTHSVNVLG